MTENKITLKFLGKQLGKVYHGFDDGMTFTATLGNLVSVSETTAKRLLKDFPNDFEQTVAEQTPKVDSSWTKRRR